MRIKDFVDSVKSSLAVYAIENTEGSYEKALTLLKAANKFHFFGIVLTENQLRNIVNSVWNEVHA